MTVQVVSGHTRIFGLIGNPVRHSLSPTMHNALFRRHGVDAVYVALEVDPSAAQDVATGLRTLGISGANLTVPLKEAILPFLDSLSPTAEQAGAVNVILNEDGVLRGDNVDGEGFVRGLRPLLGPGGLEGRTVLVLGTGGAGRAVAAGVAAHGARTVLLANRTRARAVSVSVQLTACFPNVHFRPVPFDEQHFPKADLVVNCTSGGAADSVSRFDIGGLRQEAIWCDLNYWMREPPLFQACRARGIVVQDGLPMLVHQGCASFERFTGIAPEPGFVSALLAS